MRVSSQCEWTSTPYLGGSTDRLIAIQGYVRDGRSCPSGSVACNPFRQGVAVVVRAQVDEVRAGAEVTSGGSCETLAKF
ncbi:hypothetical protein GCM10009610_65930 [Pseudonocardia xinjiangensis]